MSIKTFTTALRLLNIIFMVSFLTACGSTGGKGIDDLLGGLSNAPILTAVPNQTIQQDNLLTIDVNNIKPGDPGNDDGMSYTCVYELADITDPTVKNGQSCINIPNSNVTFSPVSGILKWTPHSGILGNYSVKITGTNSDGTADAIFNVGVRLTFAGITNLTAITGLGATIHWTPNLQATGYQLFQLNTTTGQYELIQTIADPTQSSYTITTFAPNTGYTIRLESVDGLGNLDGNIASRSFTTTLLTKFSMTPATATSPSGIAQTITVQAFNADDTPQTVGGVELTPSISAGSSSGTFSAVTDNNNGSYTFTFTPNVVGTADTIVVSETSSYFLNNNTVLTVVPGVPNAGTSSITTSANPVVSGNSVTITATLKDVNSNPISSGVLVTFGVGGGTSTGTLSAVTNMGNGVYTATYTGVVSGTAQTINLVTNGANLGVTTPIQVVSGLPTSSNSTFTISAPTVASGNAVTITATLKDINNNPVSSGIAVAYNAAGGTSSGTISAITNVGNGVYTATYTGLVAGTAQSIFVTVNGANLGLTVNIQVIAGVAYLPNSSLTITSTSVSSGGFVTVTATLNDINNNPLTAATVAFTKTGGTSTGTFGAVTNQGNGVYNARYTGLAAGTAQTIGVTSNGTDLGTNVTIQVVPGSPDASHSSITVTPSSLVSGNTANISALVRDANGNTISSGPVITITAVGGTSTGTLSGVTNVGNGVYTATYLGLVAGSAQTINLIADGISLGPTATVTVTPGLINLANSSLVTSNNSIASGTSATITATLLDVNNNPINGTITFTKTGGTSTGTLGSVTNQGGGVYTITYSGIVAGTPQNIKVLITGVDSGLAAVAQSVVPAAPSNTLSTITIASATVVSGNSDLVTVTLKDLNNNLISSGPTVGISVTGGTSTGTLSAITNVGNGVYTATYSGLVAGSAQTLGILINTAALGPSTPVTVIAGGINLVNSSLTTSSASINSGTTATITATLLDVNSNPVSGTVTFTKTAGTSTGTFGSVTNLGSGVYTIVYTGVVAGTAQNINVLLNGAATAVPSVAQTVVPAAPSSTLSTITIASSSVVSGNSDLITMTLKDLNSNLISSGVVVGVSVAGGTSTGTLSAITNAGNGVYTATYTGTLAGSAQSLGITINTAALGPSTSVTVIPGGINLVNSSLTTSSASILSGTTATITATLLDVNSNPVTGTVSFTKTGGTSTGNFGSVTNLGSGVYTIVYTGVVAGTAQNINVLLNAAATAVPAVTQIVTPAAPSATLSNITMGSSSVVSGNNDSITINLRDLNNNPISSGPVVTITASNGTSTGNLSAVANAGSGVYTATYGALTAGSAQTINLITDGNPLGPVATVTVTPGLINLANSSLTTTSASINSGTSATITATLLDVNNNPIASSSTITFTKTGGTSTGTFGTVTNVGSGVYTITYAGLVAGTAQNIKVLINGTDSGIAAVAQQVVPAAPDSTKSTITIASANDVSGASDLITVTLKDLNSNTIPSGVTVGVSVTGGTSTGTLSAITNAGAGVYTATYTGIVAGSAQTLGILVNTVALGPTTTVTVTPGLINVANSSLTTTSTSINSGTTATITATLLDVNSNPISSSSTITFTKTGGTSTGTFGTVTNLGSGVYTIVYTGVVSGTAQSIKALINGTDSGVAAVSETVVPAGPSSSNSTITIASANDTSGASDLITVTLKDLNNNAVTTGTVGVNVSGGSSTGSLSSITTTGFGVYTGTYTGIVAGTAQTLGILYNAALLGPTTTVTVVPGLINLANSSLVTTSASINSGTSATITATLHDVNNNAIDPTSTITFTKTGGTSTGTFGSVTAVGNGVYTIVYSGLVAGTAQSIKALINAVDSGLTPVAQTVVPAAPDAGRSTITIASATVTSGFSDTITITLKDLNNNLISSGPTVGVSVTGGTSTGNLSAITNAGSGVYTATYTGVSAGTAQTLGILINAGGLGPTTTVTVNPGSINLGNSSLSIGSNSIVSGTSTTVTATLKDINGNPISGASIISFGKTGGTSTGNFTAVVSQGNGVYTTTYAGVLAGTSQSVNVLINAVDSGLTPVLVAVTPGSPDASHSSISIASATVLSGSTDTVTATIEDANGNTISSGLAVTFSKIGGTSTGSFSAVTNMGSGQYAINYQGIVAGSAQTIGVSVAGNPLGPTTTVTVTPGAPNSGLSTLTTTGNTVVSGSNVTFTATIVDAASNPISSGILVNFTKTGGTSFGNFGSVTNQGSGVYTVVYTGITAGTANAVSANVNGSNFGPTQNIAVTVGAPSSTTSTITITSSPLQSGNTATIAALVRDANNNPITTEYAISFDAVGGTSSGTIGSVTNAGSGNFNTTYVGGIAGTAQTIRVLANSSPISGLSAPLQVTPGPVNAVNSVFTIAASTVQSGTATTLNMNLRDVNNNAITSGLTITFTKSAGASDGTIGSVNNTGSGNYNASFTATTQGTPETITLVVNATSTGMTVGVTVIAGPPTHLAITGPANPLNSIDCNGPYTATMQDASNNTTSSTSAGTAAFSSAPVGAWTGNIFSDSACTLPITGLSYGALVSSQSFYYKSYTPQSMAPFTVTPSDGTIAAGTITITNQQVLSYIGSLAAFTMAGNTSTMVADDSTGGPINPSDTIVDGTNLYVVDPGSNRILKYDLTANVLIGWIGHVGISEGMTAYDSSGACTNLTAGTLTPIWCVGGRSNPTNSAVINGPRSIAVDGTYIYVSTGTSSNRILKFNKTTGAYIGWIGRINSTAGMTPAACVSAGSGNVTPPNTWCVGGTSQTGVLDGMYNNPEGIFVQGSYLYVADQGNARVQRISLSSVTPLGWVGQVNVAPQSYAGQLASCSPIPANAADTPGWCLSGTTGTAQGVNRQNLSTNPVELVVGNEGFNNPTSVTSDGTYLYIGDASNVRVVRINLATGAFAGWMGNWANRSLAGNQPTPAAGANNYTSNWTTGGQSYPVASTYGFGTIRGLTTDGTYLYVTDDYGKLSRINLVDGQSMVWIGRVTTSPTGGYTGCSSTPVSGATPGWCINGVGNRLGNTPSTFYNPYGLSVSTTSPTKLYVTDTNNFRVQYFDLAQGYFEGWIGSDAKTATTWTRSMPVSGAVTSRWGIDDYSSGDIGANYNTVATNSTYMFQTDFAFNRIKKFNKTTGLVAGYIGQIGTFPPTGPADCVGYTSGLTPDWCTGGGRTTSGGGIQAYTNPFSMAADTNYVYVTNYSNHRVDRSSISYGLYSGWIGKISTQPTDGTNPNCTTTAVGNPSPDWCIGGAATSGNTNGMFNAPRASYFDSISGYLFVSDNTGRLMEISTTNGAFVGVLGNVSAGTGCTVVGSTAQGWCTTATGVSGNSAYGGINSASAIAANTTYIYVADSGTNRLLRFNKSTGAPAGFIGKMTNATGLNITGTGGACSGLAGFPKATPGFCFGTAVGTNVTTQTGTEDNTFNNPRGVWADDSYVYVVDNGNNRVLKIDANTGVSQGWKGLIASTSSPFAMTDSSCISAGAGAITPKWCTQGSSAPGKLMGEFDYPTGISGDTQYLYILDSHNNRTYTIPKN